MDNTGFTKGLDGLLTGLESIKGITQNTVVTLNDPEVLKHMTTEQKQLLNDATNMLNMKGLTPAEMNSKMQEIIARNNIKG